MRDHRVRPPHDHQLGAVADLAERRRAGTDRLVGAGGRAVVDHRADRLGETHGAALRLNARPPEAVDERRARLPEDRGGGIHSLIEARVAAVDARERRAVAERGPRLAERARPPVVAGAAAPGARHAGTSMRSPAACASRSASASCAVVTSVQIGRPAAILSPGCGTSRTPRNSPTTTSSVANSTALPAGRTNAASTRGNAPAQPLRCASKTSMPYAAWIASSDAVGRGLTSSVHARSPSQMKSTPK